MDEEYLAATHSCGGQDFAIDVMRSDGKWGFRVHPLPGYVGAAGTLHESARRYENRDDAVQGARDWLNARFGEGP